ncbi:hypothetical protein CAOG_06092 [Capsaspora owczarzaki ATCC 30864]|uniref:Trichome birefringence-like C-terminal domain-containing protein n=1 Tax=Capsaspora owczarzaki (strain ATCC 30864) TaxID=595528 RepID=A0A0D2WTC7_CAPO3|nr:hypothetical protein CAOG_06092 [Capsaspora owczarzaki ATCC 30864]KJE95665.1 hypothetical protein CAOG_006092 [Capsaspora owczarzaki ATCC 30864]|eukprot:XP_004345682.1 hypothetical protein CAOG_06092 [Capsaspora owczarzaki ATCC 30864]
MLRDVPRFKVLVVFAGLVLITTALSWASVWSETAVRSDTSACAQVGSPPAPFDEPAASPQRIDHAAVALADPRTTEATTVASSTASEPEKELGRSESHKTADTPFPTTTTTTDFPSAAPATQKPSPTESALPVSPPSPQPSSAPPRGWYQLPEDHPRVLARLATYADWNRTFIVYEPQVAWRCPYEDEARWFWDTDTLAEIGVDWKTALTVALTNKTIGLHGDSLTMETTSVLLNLVESAGFELVQAQLPEGLKPDITRVAAYFPTLNFTLFTIYLPYLVDMKGAKPYPVLNLDRPSESFTAMTNLVDVMVINVGMHLMSNNYKIENSSWVDVYAHIMGMAREEASARHDRNPAARTFFRLTPPRHFQDGDYHNGGWCKNSQIRRGATYTDFFLGGDQFIQNRIVLQETARDPRLEILDVVPCSIERVDAHRKNDCVHFCLPAAGPVRVWVEMLVRRLYEGRV